MNDIADSSYVTIKFVRATDLGDKFRDGGLDIARALNKTPEGFTISNRFVGTRIHNTFMKQYRIPGTRLRADGLETITTELKRIYELKPYNIPSARGAVKQILTYSGAIGGRCELFIVLY